jgi:hypothetical protein
MENQIVIDVTFWQAAGIVLGAMVLMLGMIGGILRLWLQPLVGQWIDLALQREGRYINGRIEQVKKDLTTCQNQRSDRNMALTHDIARVEAALNDDIREIKAAVGSVIGEVKAMGFAIAEAKTRVEDLTKAVDRLVAARNGGKL